MRIVVPLRDDENVTNKRNRCLAEGFATLGHEVRYMSRGDYVKGFDLVLHTGFAGSRALVSAIQEGIPYIICEAPTWRGRDPHVAEMNMISWTYNGLLGGGFHPVAPSKERPHPQLQPVKTEGDTIIFAQKPSDHSLRGSNHTIWVEQMLRDYPGAELRHHPTMSASRHVRENCVDALDRCGRAVTYNSTVGTEALIAGCISKPYSTTSAAYTALDREAWIHELSWWNCSMKEAARPEIATHILSGYDVALDRAKHRRVELPRPKQQALGMDEYYRRFGND